MYWGKKKMPLTFVSEALLHLGTKEIMPSTLMLEAYMDNASNLGVSGNILLPLTLVSEALFACF